MKQHITLKQLNELLWNNTIKWPKPKIKKHIHRFWPFSDWCIDCEYRRKR